MIGGMAGYLPHRQLRNADKLVNYNPQSYLPHRQLRKNSSSTSKSGFSYLPHRQLRNLARTPI